MLLKCCFSHIPDLSWSSWDGNVSPVTSASLPGVAEVENNELLGSNPSVLNTG